MFKIVIPHELIDLNKFINTQRANRFGGAKLKKDQTNLCTMYVKRAMKHHDQITNYPLMLTFNWYAKDRRKDPDNIAFGKKFILDAMQDAGIIENDGFKQIYGFKDTFQIDKSNPRVEVEVRSKSDD